ncbi:hypothetical protein F2P81_004063 [Scophthalmus maximus]|uniref:Uncharacterized protein n=1 Tax=Scophthalmus maximus TaxID=52904 RepID=A0A6A4T575_SCOMX|nr:hypothetical protein F2P81_004063 [Scophthalmus maximus]
MESFLFLKLLSSPPLPVRLDGPLADIGEDFSALRVLSVFSPKINRSRLSNCEVNRIRISNHAVVTPRGTIRSDGVGLHNGLFVEIDTRHRWKQKTRHVDQFKHPPPYSSLFSDTNFFFKRRTIFSRYCRSGSCDVPALGDAGSVNWEAMFPSCGPPFPFNMLPRVRTMHTSSRLPSGALLCALLLLLSRGAAAGADQTDAESEEALSPRALRDFYPKGPNLTSEKQLCEGYDCSRKHKDDVCRRHKDPARTTESENRRSTTKYQQATKLHFIVSVRATLCSSMFQFISELMLRFSAEVEEKKSRRRRVHEESGRLSGEAEGRRLPVDTNNSFDSEVVFSICLIPALHLLIRL